MTGTQAGLGELPNKRGAIKWRGVYGRQTEVLWRVEGRLWKLSLALIGNWGRALPTAKRKPV